MSDEKKPELKVISKDSTNVVQFKRNTPASKKKETPRRLLKSILKDAKDLDRVIVMGVGKNGNIIVGASEMTLADCNLDIDVLKQLVISQVFESIEN